MKKILLGVFIILCGSLGSQILKPNGYEYYNNPIDVYEDETKTIKFELRGQHSAGFRYRLRTKTTEGQNQLDRYELNKSTSVLQNGNKGTLTIKLSPDNRSDWFVLGITVYFDEEQQINGQWQSTYTNEQLIRIRVKTIYDKDRDGVLDKDDECPNQAGPSHNKGCPIPDTDGDGVLDDQDNCPNERGPASNKGCPLPDYDNDGVPDSDDQCPTQVGNEAYNGCPHPENVVYQTRGKNETACKDIEVRGDMGTPVGVEQVISQTIIAGNKIQVFPSTSRKITWLRINPDLCDYSPIPTQSARIVNVEEVTVELQPKVEEQQESTVQPTKESTIVIAPNPVTNGQFTLQLNLGQSSDIQITIYNFTGNRVQHVSSKFYGRGQHTIPIKVNQLRSGQYIVKVTTAEGVLSKHLIIK